MEIFCERLKELRQLKNWSLRDLANQVKVSQTAINRWEKNLRIPNIDNLKQLAIVFNVSADYLIGLENN